MLSKISLNKNNDNNTDKYNNYGYDNDYNRINNYDNSGNGNTKLYTLIRNSLLLTFILFFCVGLSMNKCM